MWDYVIEKHGRKEFEAVYDIIKELKDKRFSEESQKLIAAKVNISLTPLGMSD